MQDILDARSPMQHCHSDSDDDNSEDGERPRTENENYRIAESELKRFDEY